ncbi:MAG TPA: MBL fold metallo-hydrolase [Methylomirabilota bacterium]|nr:MBL fold metallo-hydrolase [Methylomirabilota bacterium]
MLVADRLEVLVLVDNSTDSLSTTPRNVVPEWAGLLAAGRLPTLSGEAICRAHHGLSLLLTAHVGEARHSLLFDAGPAGSTLARNATILGVDWGAIEAVVLSHGHWDHGGGLLTAIELVAQRRSPGRFDCFVHPGMFRQRASQRPDGALFVYERLPEPERLAKAGANVVSTQEPQTAVGGVFYVSGEVPRVTPYEVGLPGHLRRAADGSWEPDPLIMDERFVSVHVRDKGQFVFSACSHAGIVNVLTHAREVFPSVPLYGAMGGLHLSGATERIIPETVGDLKRFELRMLAPGHCTGWRALSALAREFGDELAPSAVGKRYLI